MIVRDLNKAIDIGEWSISGGDRLERFYCISIYTIYIYIYSFIYIYSSMYLYVHNTVISRSSLVFVLSAYLHVHTTNTQHINIQIISIKKNLLLTQYLFCP